jgi:hypothetical protein
MKKLSRDFDGSVLKSQSPYQNLIKALGYADTAIKLNIEIKVDGKTWINIDVKDQFGNDALNEFEAIYEKIISNKNNVSSSTIMRSIHQLRKKYG